MSFDPDGHFLAVASVDRSTNPSHAIISVFAVDNGQLSTQPVWVEPFACDSVYTPYNRVTFNSTGDLLAASCNSGDIWVFRVGVNGALSRGVNSPFATGTTFGTSVAFSPDGKLLATPDYNAYTVSLWAVDPTTGAISLAAPPAPTGPYPYWADFGPAEGPFGELLATADYYPGTISLFSVSTQRLARAVAAAVDAVKTAVTDMLRRRPGGGHRADPSLTPLPESPIVTGGGGDLHPDTVTFSPNGHLLATGDRYTFQGFSLWAPTGGLQIRKTTNFSSVVPGEVLRYRIKIHNPNLYPVTATVTDDLADVLDKGTYQNDVRATVPAVKVDTTTRLLTWQGNLAAGQTVVIRYSVKITAEAGGIVTNRVTGPSTSNCGPGTTVLPCQTETPIVPPPGPGADLSLTKIASTHTTHPGSQVLYTLAVHNHGPRNATGVIVSDPVPAGLFFVSAKPSQGSCALTATDLTCHLGSMRSGGGALILLEATVADNARGTITNLADVYGDQHDPHPSNNTGRSTITVTQWPEPPIPPKPPAPDERVADLVVAKHGPHTAIQGQPFRYRITVTNRGPDSAPEVALIDAAQLPLRVVSIHASQGSCHAGPPIRCALGTLHRGAHATVTVTAIATTVGRQINSAVVMSPDWDPGPGDNLGEAETIIRPAPRPPPPSVTG